MNAKSSSLILLVTAALVLGLLVGRRLPSAKDQPVVPSGRGETAISNEPESQVEAKPAVGLHATIPSGSVEGELARAAAETNHRKREAAFAQLEDDLADADIPRAMAFLAKDRQMNAQQRALFGDLASRWASIDPKAALSWALSQSSFQTRTNALEQMAETWAANDPKAAAAYGLALPAGGTRETLLGSVIKSWVGSDPTGAMAWATQLPAGELRNRILARTLAIYAQSDAPAAAVSALAMPAGDERYNACKTIASCWAEQDSAAAIEWVRGLPGPLKQDLVAVTCRSLLGQEKPQLAADLALSEPATESQISLLGELAGQWAARDLSGAIDWAKQLPEGRGKDAALRNLSHAWANSNPQAAMEYAQTLPSSVTAQGFLESVAGTWARNDPAAATAWAQNVTDPDFRKSSFLAVMKSWANASPEAAATYAVSLPAGDLQDMAVMKVIGEWAFWKDPQGAANWVSQFPDGKLRDKAIGPIIFWGQGKDPAAIASMLDTIGSADLIRQHGEQLATIWLDRDAKAARSWIERAPLPDEAKQRLLALKTGQ